MHPTLFSFGYWGWGSATAQLVEAVDAVEQERGFGPPIFVDLRRLRDVRAVGFRGDAFGKTTGADRYVWMRSLGNLNVEEWNGEDGIRIAEPAAAEELLDRVIEAAASRRRVIAFCSCEFPAGCHRAVVMELVRAAASRRGVQLTTVEWPGGEPRSVDLDVAPAIVRAVAGGSRTSLPLGTALPSPALCGLPWASTVYLGPVIALAGPARADARGWSLPVLDTASGPGADASMHRGVGECRSARGWVPSSSAATPHEAPTAEAGTVEFHDAEPGSRHDAFMSWRRRHPDGCYLTLSSRTKANLHRCSCKHQGDYDWVDQAWGGGSATRKRKVCALTAAELDAWGFANAVAIQRCRTCKPPEPG